MELPREIWQSPNKPELVRLLRSLYGLKQAGLLWNEHLHKVLSARQFARCCTDVCMYMRRGPSGAYQYVLVYVDDFALFAKNKEDMNDLRELVGSLFLRIRLDGPIKHFLGIEIHRDRNLRAMYLTQKQYIRETLQKYGVTKDGAIPGVPTVDLREAEIDESDNMQDLIGSLRFLADRSRPDILAAVNLLSSAAAHPGPEHRKAGTKILRYLHGTPTKGILLRGNGPMQPECFCDASHVRNGDSKSQYGYCIRLYANSGMVICKSAKATTVHLSPAESETHAAVAASCEIEWLRCLLTEIGWPYRPAVNLYCDSTAVVVTSHQPGNFPKQKHYLMRINKLQGLIKEGIINLCGVTGEDNIADTLTKNLPKATFKYHTDQLLGECT
jgi:hypothetical protein